MHLHLVLIALFCEPNKFYIKIEKRLLDYDCKKWFWRKSLNFTYLNVLIKGYLY